MTKWRCWEGGAPRKGFLHPSFPYLALCLCVFHWLFLSSILYNKPVSRVPSYALWTVLANSRTWGGRRGNPWFKGGQPAGTYDWFLKGGAILWSWALNGQELILTSGRCVRTEMSCWTSGWWRKIVYQRKNPNFFVVVFFKKKKKKKKKALEYPSPSFPQGQYLTKL